MADSKCGKMRTRALLAVAAAFVVAMGASAASAADAYAYEAAAKTGGGLQAVQAQTAQVQASAIPMHRLYNPYTGEHFYTADEGECDKVIASGWQYEGVGWVAPTEGDPVYRLYNAYGGEHHYTPNADERASLLAAGWTDEGQGWLSGGGVPLYREYNPFMESCNHNYTTDGAEHAGLVGLGWTDEGVAWYGDSAGYIVPADAVDAWVGTWNLVDGSADDPAFDRNALLVYAAMGYRLHVEIAEDGTCSASVGNAVDSTTYGGGRWAAKDATTGYVYATYENELLSATMTISDDGKLTVSVDQGWATFEKTNRSLAPSLNR